MSARTIKFLLATSMFVMGACGLVYEYVLSVLGNYLLGSSHEEIFIVIGLMMFAMGVGSYIQRVFKSHLFDRFLLLEVLLGIVGGFAASAVYSFFAVSESYRIVLYFFCFLIGALIGMEIPILIRINKDYSSSLRTNLAEILSVDYVGALVGAIVFTYFLLTNLSLTRIGFVLGLANLSVAAGGLGVFWQYVKRRRTIAVAVGLGFVALSYGLWVAPIWSAWAEQRFFQDPIVYRATTPYQHIVVTEREDRTRLYLNGHLQFSSVDEAIYHEYLVHPAMSLCSSPKRVLVLGGGDGLALREILQYPAVESVTVVDIDPEVTRLAATLPRLVELNQSAFRDARVSLHRGSGLEEGELVAVTLPHQRSTRKFRETEEVAAVRVINVDADLFLREVEGEFEIAFLDFPDPGTLEVAKLYSREFYAQLRKRLVAGALVSVQSTSPFHAKEVFLSIGATLRAAGFSALPYHANVPSFGEWGWHLATPGPGREAELGRQLRHPPVLKVETRHLTPELVSASTLFAKGWLESTEPIRPHTRLEPVLLQYHRRSWQGY